MGAATRGHAGEVGLTAVEFATVWASNQVEDGAEGQSARKRATEADKVRHQTPGVLTCSPAARPASTVVGRRGDGPGGGGGVAIMGIITHVSGWARRDIIGCV